MLAVLVQESKAAGRMAHKGSVLFVPSYNNDITTVKLRTRD